MQRTRVTLLIPDGERPMFVREAAEAGMAAYDVKPGDPTIWQLPGGGLDPGESIYECAIREALEETGLVVRPERITHLHELLDPHEPFFQINVFVLVSMLSGTPHVPDDDHVLEVGYFSHDEARRAGVVAWSDLNGIWEDLVLGFPAFRHLGTERVAADGARSTVHEFPRDTRA